MPNRRGHGPREELIPEGLMWRPPGDSSPGWHFVRPSRSHGRNQRQTTSNRDPEPMIPPSYDLEARGVLRRQAEQHGLSPSYPAYWSRVYQQDFYGFGYHFQYSAVERLHQSGYSQVASTAQSSMAAWGHGHGSPWNTASGPDHDANLPQETTDKFKHDQDASHSNVTSSNHNDDIAKRYAHIPKHVRQHPRFWEVADAAEAIKKFKKGDREFESYEEVLNKIMKEINKDIKDTRA